MNETAATQASDFVTVTDTDGIRGFISRTALAAVTPNTNVAVQLNQDQRIFIHTNLLQQTDADSYTVPFRFAEIEARADETVTQTNAALPRVDDEFLVVPVLEETLHVDKRQVEAGRVRVTKTVEERTETVEAPVMVEEVSVERVQINRQVETAPPVRYEGDVMIVPLVEEVLVVEKRLMLREELRISKQRTEKQDRLEVSLRSEQATIERIETVGEDASQPS